MSEQQQQPVEQFVPHQAQQQQQQFVPTTKEESERWVQAFSDCD